MCVCFFQCSFTFFSSSFPSLLVSVSLSFSVHSDCFWVFPIRLTCFLSSLLALRHFTQLSLFLNINRFPYFFFQLAKEQIKKEKRSVEFVFHIPSSLSLKNKKEKLNLRLSFFFYCCLLLLLLVRLGRFSVRRVSFFFCVRWHSSFFLSHHCQTTRKSRANVFFCQAC